MNTNEQSGYMPNLSGFAKDRKSSVQVRVRADIHYKMKEWALVHKTTLTDLVTELWQAHVDKVLGKSHE